MLYYANPCNEEVRDAMRAGLIGFIDTPMQGNKHVEGADWVADNGCFSNRWVAEKWWGWLNTLPTTMRFACCPDIVGDWDTTRTLFDIWYPKMDAIGIPVACVAQDGAEIEQIDWDSVSCIFIGGSTDWKLSAKAVEIIGEANRRNIWAHVGRVNSLRRMRWAQAAGADSVDGTHIVFEPTKGLQDVLRWSRIVNSEGNLFEETR